jgi:hemolysin activation/secretion protein
VSVGDWGSPLSFGSSVSAFLFGRDEGFYYRASGAELRWATDAGAPLEWRLFGEQQRAARPHTDFSLGAPFIPNIDAARGPSFGASLRSQRSFGLDPRGFRAFTDFRAEAATGDSTYGRTALDVALSRGLPGRLAASLTLAGGTSAGQLPVQRRWFLGGAETVRGQAPDTAQSGSAFWLSRFELGPDRGAYKIMLFGDLGWVGDRRRLGEVGRPLSGVGIGTSVFDGLLRFDVARGIYPRRDVRVSAYLEMRY